jgi:hypothetical protein
MLSANSENVEMTQRSICSPARRKLTDVNFLLTTAHGRAGHAVAFFAALRQVLKELEEEEER